LLVVGVVGLSSNSRLEPRTSRSISLLTRTSRPSRRTSFCGVVVSVNASFMH